MSDKVKKKIGAKKVISIVVNVLVYIFFAVCIAVLVLSVMAKKDSDGAVNIFGSQMRIVISDSMAKCDETDVSNYEIKDSPVKSVVFIQTVPEDETQAKAWYEQLKVGDVLTFKYVYGGSQDTITHRIISIDGTVITLAGDNKSSQDGYLTQVIDYSQDTANYVIGKVTGTSYFLGLAITALKSPVGIICIVIVPCLIIVVLEVIKIVGVLSENKKKKQAEEQKKKDDELEELKKKLAQLENLQKTADSGELSAEQSADTLITSEENKQ